jgi:type VI secretion system protein
MAGDRGLLDRLRRRDGFTGRSAQPRTEHVHESIQRHLQRLLNTRKGESAAFPDFGLPALSDVDLSTSGEELRRQLEAALRQYEPRLTGVRVTWLEPDPLEPLRLRFEVTGKPIGVKDRVTFRFATVVDTPGAGFKVSD